MTLMDHPKDPATARLERLINQLQDQISEKKKEIQELKEQILHLQRARHLVAHEPGPPYRFDPDGPQGERSVDRLHFPTTLRSAAIEVLQGNGAESPEDSMSAAEVAVQ